MYDFVNVFTNETFNRKVKNIEACYTIQKEELL